MAVFGVIQGPTHAKYSMPANRVSSKSKLRRLSMLGPLCKVKCNLFFRAEYGRLKQDGLLANTGPVADMINYTLPIGETEHTNGTGLVSNVSANRVMNTMLLKSM